MKNINDFIQERGKDLTDEEFAGVKSRLIFAGLSETLSPSELALADNLFDDVLCFTRTSFKAVQKHAEIPEDMKDEYAKASQNGELVVSLINDRKVRFNPKNNVVTPLKNVK